MNTAPVMVLSGGVGGAKLALGLYRVLSAGRLLLAINTGDDFEHLGLRICPDIDTALYTLASLADPVRGWGRRDETWHFMSTMAELGGDSWFQLGDADLALHVLRTQQLTAGISLGAFTQTVADRLGIQAQLVPMSDQSVSTLVDVADGALPFQDYFVRLRCEPAVRGLRFIGADTAQPRPELLAALADPALRAVIIAPSNPFLSIDPMLAMPALRDALRQTAAPVIAVSPVIGGRAVKGPTVKIMRELGLEPSAVGVAHHYAGLIDGFLLDQRDTECRDHISVATAVCDTLMKTLADRERVARAALALADSISGRDMAS